MKYKNNLSLKTTLFGDTSVEDIESRCTNLSYHNFVPDNTPVPKGLKQLLGLGLSFCATPPSLKKTELLDTFNELRRSIRTKAMFIGTPNNNRTYNKRLYVKNKDWSPPKSVPKLERVLDTIETNIMTSKLRAKGKKNLNSCQQETLQDLLDRNDLKVVITDKNLGPALFTTQHYIDLCLDELMTDSYRQISTPIEDIENTLRKIVERIKTRLDNAGALNTKIITADIMKKTTNTFYILAKIHKPTLKIRPIITTCNGITGGLSKWLDNELQPIMRNQHTYIKDSDQLKSDLSSITVEPGDVLITVDVVSMYPNVDLKRALAAIKTLLPDTEKSRAILSALRIVMDHNHFSFSDTNWKQLKGTAMGTACAPCFASIFLGAIETPIIQSFQNHIRLVKRFIDDKFLLWNYRNDPHSFKHFIAQLTRNSGFEFTYVIHEHPVEYMDLCILRDGHHYETKTYEKKLNLFLYLPATSAHPPGQLKSLVFGRIKKYRTQNDRKTDLQYQCQNLFDRLKARGYRTSVLMPIFKEAIIKSKRALVKEKEVPQVFAKVKYDPNGPSQKALSKLFEFETLKPILNELEIEKATICYTKPTSLGNLLCPSKFKHPVAPLLLRRLSEQNTLPP